MAEIDLSILLLCIPVMAVAGFIHGALGLGFPLVATPVIAVFIDVKAAIILTLLPTVTVNIASVLSAKNIGATVSKYQPLMLATLVGGVAGSILLAVTDPSPYRLLLALLIVSFLLTSHFNFSLNIQPTTAMMILFGVFAGCAGGITNVTVAVLIIYFLSVKVERSEMIPAMNLCFLVSKSSQMVVFLVLGVINLMTLLYTAPLALVSFVGLKVGQSYANRIPADRYRNILKVILLVLAAVLVIQFFIGLSRSA